MIIKNLQIYLTGKALKNMEEKKRIVKRNIINANRKKPVDRQDEIQKNEENPNCTGTALVYCNQWECFTRFLCLEKNSGKDPKKVLSENE